MKKLMYLLPLAAMALASCSSDETLEQSSLAQDNQVQIVPAVQKQTRGTLTTLSNLDFHLDATGAFKSGATYETATAKTTISEDLSNPAFKLSTDTWWADATTTATFTAYAPKTLSTADVMPAADIADQKDIVVAYNEGVKGDFTAGVPLTFRHVLSQIVVKAANKSAEAVTIKVKGVKLVNINSKNNLTLPTTSTAAGFDWADYTPWAAAPTVPTSYKATWADNSEKTLSGEAQEIVNDGPMLLLPQQLTNATISEGAYSGNCIVVLIKVVKAGVSTPASYSAEGAADYYIYPTAAALAADENASASGYAWAYVPVNTKWEPGKKYVYTLNYAEDAYGSIGTIADQGDGGTLNPNRESAEDPGEEPGEPVVEGEPVPLTFTVSVAEWEDVTENKNL